MARQKWNKESVIEAIRARHKAGLSLRYSDVVHDDEALSGSARRYFGSWYDAVNAAGYDIAEIRKRSRKLRSWDRPTVLKEIKAYAESGGDLSAGSVRKKNPKLYAAAVSHFGSWKTALGQMGIDYEEIRLTKEWSPDKVIQVIREAYAKGADLSDNTVATLRQDLYGAANTHFGAWSKALEAAGINPQDARRTKSWDREKLIDAARKGYEQGITFTQMTNAGFLDSSTILRYFKGGMPELAKEIGVVESEASIDNNLESLMREKGISIKRTALLIGRTDVYVSHIAKAKYLPKLIDALLIASALDCDVRDIWTIKNTPPSQ